MKFIANLYMNRHIHRSLISQKCVKKTIVINGLSKSHSMTGWRIGLLFAPRYLAGHILKVHQYNVTCATSIAQYAAIEALTAAKDAPKMMRHQYKKTT